MTTTRLVATSRTDPPEIDRPYPLRSRFRRIILPSLALLLAASATATGYGAVWLTETIYLELAQRRAETIDRVLADHATEAWFALKTGGDPVEIYRQPSGVILQSELTKEVSELGLTHLKIYRTDGVILFSTSPPDIGTRDPSPAFLEAVVDGEPSIVRKDLPAGAALYELYVPLSDRASGSLVVFELYEPVGYLDAILVRVVAPAIMVPALVLLLVALAMTRLVGRAQTDINRRTEMLIDFRNRLQRFVSHEATDAVRNAVGGGELPSRRVRATILFSDIRDFTSYAEVNPPEAVVAFLNRAMEIVIAAIGAQGGDVDKMIGDAVLAHFQGDGADKRAIAAGLAAVRAVEEAGLPRGIGIGIYSGDVISGAIGPRDRMDFTVIGDTVNIAARLCATATRGEVVADAATATDVDGFGAEETIAVKGRAEPILARRWRRPD